MRRRSPTRLQLAQGVFTRTCWQVLWSQTSSQPSFTSSTRPTREVDEAVVVSSQQLEVIWPQQSEVLSPQPVPVEPQPLEDPQQPEEPQPQGQQPAPYPQQQQGQQHRYP